MNGPEFQVVEREMAPRLAAFVTRSQNEALFKRIESVYNSPEGKAEPGATTIGLALLHKLRSLGARLGTDARRACRKSTRSWPDCLRSSVKMFWLKRTISFCC
jgi:peptidyl-dipeptidase Dcp